MMRAALCIWILSALVCLGRSHPVGSDQDTALDSDANSLSLVTSANKEFTYRLYRKIAAHADSQDKNVFFSPRCLSVALAALSVGARGETHQQIFRGLGFNSSLLTQENVNVAFRMLIERANNASAEDTNEGTAVFVDDKFKLNPDFLEALKQYYFAEGFTVDFSKTTESANTINNYVAKQTKGKIDKLVDRLSEDTIMYLISYIYFKGKWEKPFYPKWTIEDEFFVDENTKVPVQMMNMEKIFNVYYDNALNTSVLQLPFNTSYSMLLMLPDDMATLEENINPGHVTQWLKSMQTRRYNIFVPKFSIKISYNLKDILIDMGMSEMFSAHANLNGISDGATRLSVSDVVHKATLDVDEAGATAPAVTTFGVGFSAYWPAPELKFNRPFMVTIVDRVTGDTLFMGKIINPNK